MMRRAILALALATAAPAAADPAPGRLEFEVTRNGRPFGSHVFSVTEANGAISMRERARFRATIGPVTVYRYEHDCDAAWRGGELYQLNCTTLKDGRRVTFTGSRQGESFVVRGDNGERRFALSTPPSLFISLEFLRGGSYIDTETGLARTLRVTQAGQDTILVGGASIPARRYRVQGSLTMDAWYDDAGRWVAAAFDVGDQRIEYRLVSPRTQAPR